MGNTSNLEDEWVRFAIKNDLYNKFHKATVEAFRAAFLCGAAASLQSVVMRVKPAMTADEVLKLMEEPMLEVTKAVKELKS